MQPDSDSAFEDYYPRGHRLSPQDQINELRSIVEEQQREQRRALTIVVLCVYCFLIGRVLARADNAEALGRAFAEFRAEVAQLPKDD